MIKVIVDVSGFTEGMEFTKDIRDAGERAMKAHIKDDVVPMFEKTTELGWEKKPKFIDTVTPAVQFVVGKVVTMDEIWALVNAGAKRHDIPKQPGFVSFQTGYVAKTKPGWIGSQQGGSFGEWVTQRQVQHPGFEARDFVGAIAKEIPDKLIEKFRKELEVL